MRFTLDQITAFDSIVRLGSFNAAARQLCLTQPTISLRIRELEVALGTVLFTRHGSHITLTPEGETLNGYVRRILQTSQEITAQFNKDVPLHGNLRFGTTDTFAQICLLELIGRIEQIYPGIKISVCVDKAVALSRLLESGGIDLAIMGSQKLQDNFVRTRLGYNTYAWVVGASEELQSVLLKPDDLALRHVVISDPPSILHQIVTNWFSDAGVIPSRISTCNDLSVTVQMVSTGIAIGVLPMAIVRREIISKRIRILPVSPPLSNHEVSICYPNDSINTPLRKIVRIVQELVLQHNLFESYDPTLK